MQKIQTLIASSILITGLGHIFCCGLPLLFSFLSILVGLGVTTVFPAGLVEFHEAMHAWELPILIFSGIVLFIGWSLHIISERIDCHNTGCVHEPCGQKKKKSHRILIMATILFCMNSALLFIFHDQGIAIEDHHVTEKHIH